MSAPGNQGLCKRGKEVAVSRGRLAGVNRAGPGGRKLEQKGFRRIGERAWPGKKSHQIRVQTWNTA